MADFWQARPPTWRPHHHCSPRSIAQNPCKTAVFLVLPLVAALRPTKKLYWASLQVEVEKLNGLSKLEFGGIKFLVGKVKTF